MRFIGRIDNTEGTHDYKTAGVRCSQIASHPLQVVRHLLKSTVHLLKTANVPIMHAYAHTHACKRRTSNRSLNSYLQETGYEKGNLYKCYSPKKMRARGVSYYHFRVEDKTRRSKMLFCAHPYKLP